MYSLIFVIYYNLYIGFVSNVIYLFNAIKFIYTRRSFLANARVELDSFKRGK